MNESNIEDRLDLNSGKEWLETDLFDLANSVRLKNLVEEIAIFLCRPRREVREKIAELEQSCELARRIEETAANAQPE
jgi:hypothetical protein